MRARGMLDRLGLLVEEREGRLWFDLNILDVNIAQLRLKLKLKDKLSLRWL